MASPARDLLTPVSGERPIGRPRGTALLLALLAAVLYGRHLGEGLLADDFLYARWARQGWGVLLRYLTVDSNPQMIRPLPGLLWELTRLPFGPVVLHTLSLLLHLGNGLLLAALLRRGIRQGGGDDRGGVALAAAALFIAFPLLTEPVIWASASFDLWACLFALAALVTAAGETEDWRRAAAAAGLFLLALSCKESVLPLPLLLPLLLPWREARRPALAIALVTGAYLLFRFALFRGPGGYLGNHGASLLWDLKLLPTLRAVFLRLPLRLAVPVKRPGALAPLFALLSVLLLGGVLAPWLARLRGGALRVSLRIAAAVGLALLPVLPIFSVDVDQEGSRLIYFPVAVAISACGLGMSRLPRASRLPRTSRYALAGLLLYWSAATLWNGRAWTEAAAEVRRTREALAALAPRLPPRSQVVVAGHDTWKGAFTWRNGLTAAAEVDGLSGGHQWTLGTAAVVEDPGPWLGRSLFEIGLGPSGERGDRTACARALLVPPARSLAAWAVTADLDPAGDPTAKVVLPAVPLTPPARDLAVRLRLGTCRPRKAVDGTLFWLFADSRKFEATDSLPFVVGPGTPAEVAIHLFAEARPQERITLLLELPRELAPCIEGVRVVAVPPICTEQVEN